MWTINIFFFLAVFLAIRQADLLALIIIIPAYWYLLNLLTNMEEDNGNDLPATSSRSYSDYSDTGLLDGENDNLGTESKGRRDSSTE